MYVNKYYQSLLCSSDITEMVPFFYLFIIFLKGGGLVELIFNVSEISDPF